MNENTNYEGQGLRGPLWTIAGGTLAQVLGGIHGAFGSGLVGRGCSGEVSALESEIARLKAEKFTDEKDAALRDSLLKNWLKPLADEAAANKVKIAQIEADVVKNQEICELKMQLAEQKAATAQATTNGAIFSLQGQVCELMALTKRKVLADNVCPLPMPRYNQWSVDPLAAEAQAQKAEG